MSFTFSRVLSGATAAYGLFALVNPRHLGGVLTGDRREQQKYDLVATTYGFRDVGLSAVGMLARSPRTARTAMLLRIGFDISDAVVLAPVAENARSRNKVLAATLGWATLNTLAVVADDRRSR